MASAPGRNMITTPAIPIATLDHRASPTDSFSKIADSAVISTGAIKNMATTSATGILTIARKKQVFATTSIKPRNTNKEKLDE